MLTESLRALRIILPAEQPLPNPQLLSLSFLLGTEYWSQDLTHAGQALYHWASCAHPAPTGFSSHASPHSAQRSNKRYKLSGFQSRHLPSAWAPCSAYQTVTVRARDTMLCPENGAENKEGQVPAFAHSCVGKMLLERRAVGGAPAAQRRRSSWISNVGLSWKCS